MIDRLTIPQVLDALQSEWEHHDNYVRHGYLAIFISQPIVSRGQYRDPGHIYALISSIRYF